MKSRLSIEIDFQNNNEPVIQIMARKSDDVRDNLIESFLQAFGGESNWCAITWEQQVFDGDDKFRRVWIRPVKSENLKKVADEISGRVSDANAKKPSFIEDNIVTNE